MASSLLTLNKLLGCCNKQEIALVYRGLFSALVKVSAKIKISKLPSLLQPAIKKMPIFEKSLATFHFEDENCLKEIDEYIDI